MEDHKIERSEWELELPSCCAFVAVTNNSNGRSTRAHVEASKRSTRLSSWRTRRGFCLLRRAELPRLPAGRSQRINHGVFAHRHIVLSLFVCLCFFFIVCCVVGRVLRVCFVCRAVRRGGNERASERRRGRNMAFCRAPTPPLRLHQFVTKRIRAQRASAIPTHRQASRGTAKSS